MNARYTMTLYDVITIEPTFLENIMFFIDGEHTDKLIAEVRAMWDVYEIAGESIGEQHKFMQDTFNEFKSYYAEKIAEYDKKLDWANKDFYSVYTYNKGDTTNIHSDLPNKQIDPDDYFAYPSDTDKGENITDGNVVDKSKLLSLRRQYLSQIKDYYREFALRFAGDFIHMY